MNAEHVIFGAGSIGRATAAVLSERGEKVLLVNRSGDVRFIAIKPFSSNLSPLQWQFVGQIVTD